MYVSPIVIELITTVRPTLRSASVTVETRDHSALECIATYHVEVIPTVSVANQPPPPSVNSSENSITIHGLNFCKSNYTFRITVYGRNNITSNDTKSNVSGDVSGNIFIIM